MTGSNPLTGREIQVLESCAHGLTNEATADRLYLSLDTIKTHLRRIALKLRTRTTLESIVVAHQSGWLDLGCGAPPPMPPKDARKQRSAAQPLPPKPAESGYDEDHPLLRPPLKKWALPVRVGGKLVHRTDPE